MLVSLSVYCQLQFEELSYDDALLQSKQSGKLVFLQLESADCLQCNEVANKAFSDKELGDFYNQSFICIKRSRKHPDWNKIAGLFNKNNMSIGSLFIAGDGSLVHTYNRTTTLSKAYKDEADKALSKAGEGMLLRQMQQQYLDGNRSTGFLELYLKTMKGLQLNTDKLLDEYAALLPEDSLKSIRTFAFIMSMTPLLESTAYEKLGRFYEAINNKKYYSNYPLNASIKNQLAYKSMRKAILEKNEPYALRTALFAKNIYPAEPGKAARAYDTYMLDFYNGINDTARYLRLASLFYDQYYMGLSADSVRKQDTLHMNELAKKQKGVMEKKGDSVKITKQILFSPAAQSLSNKLIEPAKKFWAYTSDTVYLAQALNWAAKAIELYESYTAINTYALLLNKTGNKKEAGIWQEKAIALKKKMGFDTRSLETELKEMK